MNKKFLQSMFFIFVVFMLSMPTFCESQVIYTKGAIERAMRIESGKGDSDVIDASRKNNQLKEINVYELTSRAKVENMDKYPILMGHNETRVTFIPNEVPFTVVIETPYSFITDEEGNIGIAYIDERMNIPVNAIGGFFVLQKYNEKTGEIEWVKYCVDNSGYILFGWIVEENGNKYYLSENAEDLGQVVMNKTIQFKDGNNYIFDEDGILLNFK